RTFVPVVASDSGTGARIIEFTLTEEFKIANQLIFRVELRHDDSNQHTFTRDGHPARGDNTLGFEVIMPF
ncbi:MAG TPA: outer membrane beta-barrel protein, partial [Planctomycetota bacterium]|nr:outer membrane beta-barrel protein [Planctomycetota bacterium]